MKLKISKRTLNELSKELSVLSIEEQTSFVGGDKYVFNDQGMIIDTVSCEGNYIQFGTDGAIKELHGTFNVTNYGVSGCTMEGTAVNKDLFEMIAGETNSEWALSLNSGGAYGGDGYLATSLEQHQVAADIAYKKGYDSIYHNHGDGADGSNYDMRDIYGCPSGDDIRELNALGKDPDYDYKMFYIYNEISQDEDKYSQYVNGSTTMEERAHQLGYRLDGEP